MKPSLIVRLEQLEQAAGIGPRTHFVWQNDGEGEDHLQAEIAARIAAGTAKAGDKFLAISWPPSGGPEVPRALDRDPFRP